MIVSSILLPGNAATAHSGGPPSRRTGAPGEATCSASGCHNSSPLLAGRSGPGSLALEGLPNRYHPGSTYDLLLRIAHPGASRWGFELSSRLNEDDARGGTIALVDTDRTQIDTDLSTKPQYLKHTSAGTRPGFADGPVSYPFRWTAPPAGSGAVAFHFTGVAADNDRTPRGDVVYMAQAAVEEDINRTLSIAPGAIDVFTGESADFSAAVAGFDDPRVRWEMAPSSVSIGRLSCPETVDGMCEGLRVRYTAPAEVADPVEVLLLATSADDLSLAATARIRVVPLVRISLSSPVRTVAPGGSVSIGASVTGTTRKGVVWSVQDSAGGPEVPGGSPDVGTISLSGRYTAPAVAPAPLTAIVRARSEVDTAVFGSLSLTVVDTKPPVVSLTRPQPGALLRGIVTLAAEASDDAAVRSVAWRLDQEPTPIAIVPAAPYTIAWDSRGVADGPHTVTAQATDAAENAAVTRPISVTIDNTPPVFRSSGIGSFVHARDTLAFTPEVTDNLGLRRVSLRLDPGILVGLWTKAPGKFVWDTRLAPDGRYDLIGEAVDEAGNEAVPLRSVVVIDNRLPTVWIGRPEAGAVVTRVFDVTGTAADANFARYRLEYGRSESPSTWVPIGGDVLRMVEGGLLGKWDTRSLDAGIYSLRLTAMDQAGGSLSETRIVTVVRSGDPVPDGRTTVGDALLALQIAVGAVAGTPEQRAAADVAPVQPDGTVGDGEVTAGDVVVLLRAALGLASAE